MQLTNFSIMRRKPMEQYGHEEITVHGTFDKEESPESALREAKVVVVDVLYGAALPKIEKPIQHKPAASEVSELKVGGTPVSTPEAPETTEVRVEVAPPKAEKKPRKPKVEAEASAAPTETAPVKSEVTPEATTAPKKTKKSETVYSRETDLHKKLVGEFLDKEFPTWKKNAGNVEKAKAVSVTLVGQPFLDAEGRVLESFKQSFREKMA